MKKKLKRILEYAYNTIPYHNSVINSLNTNVRTFSSISDLKRIPPFTKETIKKYGYPNFVSPRCLSPTYDLIESYDYRIEATSGTTMERMKVPWDISDYINSTYHHWKFRYEKGRVNPRSAVICEVRIDDTELAYTIDHNRRLCINTYNINEKNMVLIFMKINEIRPEWIYMSPSALYVLLRFAAKLGLRMPNSIRYVELMSEPVLPHYMRFFDEYFNCNVYDMYGCVETNGIAYRCHHGNFHIMSNNVIVEILNDGINVTDGAEGNICVTGLYNTLMPMIRYVLNDRAIMQSDSYCTCGNKEKVIILRTTRLPKHLLLDDASIYNEGQLFRPIKQTHTFIDRDKSDILFSMSYKNVDTHNVSICINDYSPDQVVIENSFKRLMDAYGLGNLAFDFTYCESIKAEGVMKLHGDQNNS